MEVLPGKQSLSEAEVDSLRQELETVRAENQRLHIELGNSESERESLKQEVQELRLQLETEHADREEIEAELSAAEAKFCSGRHAFRKINTRCGHNSQPAPSQTQKIKNRPGGLGSHLRNYRKWRQKIITDMT
jgi:chromosome segregation ATPase